MTELRPGESMDLGTRVSGGPQIRRDPNVDDAFQIDSHGGELSRGEIRRLAQLAGLAVDGAENGGRSA